MIRTSPANHYRAAAAFVAAAVLSFNLHHASAQQNVDLFGGTLGTPATLTVGGTNANTTVNTPTNFGPGYSGTLSFTASALNTLSEGFAPVGASNSFTITQTGAATALGNTSASKTFATVLSPGATYALTLTRTNGFTVGLLSSVNIALSAGGTTFVNTASGQGLLGAVDLLSLFGTSGVATFQFTVPATAAGALGVNLTTTEPVSALGGSYTFQTATINQVVPEPRSVTVMLLGAGGLMALRFRRRLRAL